MCNWTDTQVLVCWAVPLLAVNWEFPSSRGHPGGSCVPGPPGLLGLAPDHLFEMHNPPASRCFCPYPVLALGLSLSS